MTAIGRLFVLCLLIVAGRTAGQEVAVHDFERELYEAMSSQDAKRFTQLTEKAQKARYPASATGPVMKLLFEPNKLPSGAAAAAAIPEMRIDAALYLALGSRSNVVRIDKSAVRKVVLPYVGDARQGGSHESKALATLAHLQMASDVPILLRVAESDDRNRYRTAIMSLYVMCITEARKALTDLKSKASAEKREFVSELEKQGSICP